MKTKIPTDISGQIIMITGAASGIGRQSAITFAQRGAIVAACDKNLVGLDELKIEVGSSNFYTFHIDMVNDESIIGCVKAIEDEIGPIQGLMNCAGITGENGKRAEDVNVDDFDFVYRVNLRGALVLTRTVIKAMAERKYGRILHLASMAGKEGAPLMLAYASTKAGLIGMVKTIGKEYAETGVTINALAPAMITGPMTSGFSETQFAFLKAKIPMGRLGEPEEVAEIAAWILSPACTFSTGFTFDLSGGRATY